MKEKVVIMQGSNKVIKTRRRKKKIKKNKKIKKIRLMIIVVLISIIIFLTKSSIFNIKEISFIGNSTIAVETLMPIVEDKIGKNIFTVNQRNMKEALRSNKYIKDITISRKGSSKLEISITEEAPVYYVESNNKILLLNNDMKIVEELDTIEGRKLVKLEGINISNIDVDKSSEENEISEEELNQIEAQKNILEEFYPYISQNREELKLDSLDIYNVVDIKGYIGKVEILFGDYENLHNKMENVYRIMLSENINLKEGYINVSFDGLPVIKNNN